MTTVAPALRVVPVRRVIEIASPGAHASVEYREVLRFAVYLGADQVQSETGQPVEYDAKGKAQAFCEGSTWQRSHTRAAVEAAIGVAP